MNINKMDIKELKVMAYDVASSLQKLQNDLLTINNVIIQKSQPKQVVKKFEETPKKEGN